MIRLTKDGITFEVGTEDELKIVMNVLQAKTKPTEPLKLKPDVDAFTEVYRSIGSTTSAFKILQALKEQTNGMTTSQLLEKLSLTAQALGGALGAITKQASKFGLKGESVIISRATKDGKDWIYKLSENMHKAIESA